ncbi:ATP-binding protein [uncultured Campylobacter sp.]|uniref:sensor histidine kinase n=1 Tax=uncultured Campylobacter sp. TaxID=218934 RepID=UPI002604229F|nr:ATP-binding protein [uncultured Campylobacter sp.]
MKFKISSELKNIIGKDLIVNDEVAIFELVKNSYDAHATRVDVQIGADKIVIKDNGKGMNLDDIKNKWLFVAYSAKKDNTEDSDINKDDERYRDYRNKINTKRGFAGAKGIGRFSCDRLGAKLKIISRKIGETKFHILDVNWDDFEEDAKKEFMDISINYSEADFIADANFNHGVIVEITQLRSKWDNDKINTLKRSLGKLINPFEVNTHTNNFQIYIKHNGSLFEEPVKNEIIDVLTLKTTKLEVDIKDDKIVSTLTDRGVLIYKIEENNNYKHLKNIKSILLYLNTSAKNNFYRQMGVRSVNFGHVLVFNNGFRVYPYGEIDDDSFGINQRHQQGHNRYLSTRVIVGSININEYSDQFKEKSSRDGGFIKTDGYNELEDFFWEKLLKRLEKYIVGIQWGLDAEVRNIDNFSDDIEALNTIETKSKIIQLIKTLTNSASVKILDFGKNFLNIINQNTNLQDPIIKDLISIAKKARDATILDAIDKIGQLSKEKTELEKRIYETKEENAALKNENMLIKQNLDDEIKKSDLTAKKLEQQTKINIFQSSIIGTEKEQILALQHQIFHSSSRIKRNIELLLKTIDKNTMTDRQKKYIGVVTHELDKIVSISKFVTKANFNLTASAINADIINFIREYLEELYLSSDHVIDSQIKIENIPKTNTTYKINLRPLEITTMIDNFIQNSQKAKATKIIFNYLIDKDCFVLTVEDDGCGIAKDNLDNIFQLGYTTTNGSGIGLFNIKETIKQMNGTIDVESEVNKGTKFTIRLRNEN